MSDLKKTAAPSGAPAAAGSSNATPGGVATAAAISAAENNGPEKNAAPLFLILEADLPKRLGVARDIIRAIRMNTLTEGVDWKKEHKDVVLTAAAAMKIEARLGILQSTVPDAATGNPAEPLHGLSTPGTVSDLPAQETCPTCRYMRSAAAACQCGLFLASSCDARPGAGAGTVEPTPNVQTTPEGPGAVGTPRPTTDAGPKVVELIVLRCVFRNPHVITAHLPEADATQAENIVSVRVKSNTRFKPGLRITARQVGIRQYEFYGRYPKPSVTQQLAALQAAQREGKR